ncbi:MAG: alpha amylase C-terminal domain-containing protein [Tidjanibacter sp.]|nr:alpha amylase C-terminal domain-containing protein [Tidjanibacter sp.]
MANRLEIINKDSWLEPVEGELNYRYKRYTDRLADIEASSGSIVDFANGYRYFGFQRDDDAHGWWFREWLPEAAEVLLTGDFNGWSRDSLPLSKNPGTGVWSIFLYDGDYHIAHGQLYKMIVKGANGTHDRIPAWTRRAVQNEQTKDFAAQVWLPAEPFDWQDDGFDIAALGELFIYECHIGMAQESEGVGTYAEFTKNVLPRIARDGYNVIQIMGIAEHPYYGSYGYHVSSFFAPSSRFGTPEELKELVLTAHRMNIGVVMDLVQAHYVKNLNEGLNELDGSDHCYSLAGEAGYQKYWDSKLFDYGKREVTHFLLSNVKYWLDEFHFDGYRFDGVTSMIYHHHGYTEFDSREKFFDDSVNRDALTYLTLANRLIHDFRPRAVTIAEDVSGMPGICIPIEEGGIGFDYRLAMAIPDFWIRMLKEVPDEQWNIWDIWNIMTNRLPDVGTVAYCESHDQAMVGDKTIAFRLMDKAMYSDMNTESANILIDRGMALHKMIRLATLSLGGQAYLNFMGNEFGHPEWIDFPREGNNWSYHYASRQWSLADNPLLRYSMLGEFDRQMIALAKRFNIMGQGYAYRLAMNEADKVMVFSHGDLLFVFNWNPSRSVPDYIVPVPEAGSYRIVLSTDEERFGGQGRDDLGTEHFSYSRRNDDGSVGNYMKIYTVCRTATAYRRCGKCSPKA